MTAASTKAPTESGSTQSLNIAHTDASGHDGLVTLLQTLGLRCHHVAEPKALRALQPALVLIDAASRQRYDLNSWRQYAPAVITIATFEQGSDADLILPAGSSEAMSRKLLQLALQQWALKEHTRQLQEQNRQGQRQLLDMADIGIALSAEKDLHTLLEKILREGMRMSGCDAASLFLVDARDAERRELVFKLALNDSIAVPFVEHRFPINDRSISGYVTIHGSELNIADVYQIPANAPYRYNYDFDDQVGYRCVSLLAIPMHNYRGEAVGVIEFINCKKQRHATLMPPEQALANTRPFDDNSVVLLRALASQSAVAIEHFVLLESINRLFEGFVHASVAAIEQRDPTTSGHSFRVADLCVELAQRLHHSNLSRFRHTALSTQDFKQLRYAALLHDFGKVGVREHVLTKAKKLTPGELRNIQARFTYLQERLHHRVYCELYKAHKEKTVTAALEQQLLSRLKDEERALIAMLANITEANEPALLEDAERESLREIRQYRKAYLNPDMPLITEEELKTLSIRRGSLTEDERKEIESHVQHTLEFLRLIPWTPELSGIPHIAASHHEKLDGSGYPRHLHGDDIPLASRIMTVCDIYDALTASDRPYKKAIENDRAFSILEAEARSGLLDGDLVSIFIAAKIPDCLAGKNYPKISADNFEPFSHNVCQMDLHQHLGH